jgi:hypothetical protein
LPTWLVVDTRNDLFGEPVGHGEQAGKIELLSKPIPSAKQIAEAEYDPTKEQVHVIFRDGTKVQVKL